jgi:Carboxypeptidase regulatory-like domain
MLICLRGVWVLQGRMRLRHALGWGLLAFLMVCTGAHNGANAQTSGGLGSSDSAGLVTGVVINARTGASVPRALVKLNDRAMLTDHEGKFRFEGYAGGSATVSVSKPGYSASVDPSDRGSLTLQAGQLAAPLELRLYPEAILAGSVTAPDGTPLPQIIVVALRNTFDDSGSRWSVNGQTQTDVHGEFRISMPAGEYRLETRYVPVDTTTGEAILPVRFPEGGSSNSSGSGGGSIRVRGGEEERVSLRAVTGRPHTVSVASIPATAARNARVSIGLSNGVVIPGGFARDGMGGEMKLQLPQGSYVLRAEGGGGGGGTQEEAETAVTVPDHDVAGVVLRFSPVASIGVALQVDGGATSDNGAPSLQQLSLALRNEEDGSESMLRSAGAQDQPEFVVPAGRYRMLVHGRGTWFVQSASYGDSDVLNQDLVVAPGAGGAEIQVTVSNQTGGVQGSVTLHGAAAACPVYLVPGRAAGRAVFSAASNAEGGYSVSNLPPGEYRVIAFERRHAADYGDEASLSPFSSYVQTVTVSVGDKATANLEAVPVTEMMP